MSLSAEDIVGYRFKQSLRGYAIDEVDELLDQLADQVERTAAELEELRGRVRVAEEQAASAARTEEALRRTLVTAQETAERVVAEAEQQAATERERAASDVRNLRAEAQLEADRIVEAAEVSARREASAARARVDEAVARHREVLHGVETNRDALRAHLRQLDELVDTALPEVGDEPGPSELVAGELPESDRPPLEAGAEGVDHEVPVPESSPEPDDRGQPERPTEGLKIRVRDDAGDVQAPLGSEPRGGR